MYRNGGLKWSKSVRLFMVYAQPTLGQWAIASQYIQNQCDIGRCHSFYINHEHIVQWPLEHTILYESDIWFLWLVHATSAVLNERDSLFAGDKILLAFSESPWSNVNMVGNPTKTWSENDLMLREFMHLVDPHSAMVEATFGPLCSGNMKSR